MDRLTKRVPGGIIFETPIGNLLDRLAAYEDLGFEPEQIKEANQLIAAAFDLCCKYSPDTLLGQLKDILVAEAEDRLVVLPCNIRSTIYVIESFFRGKKKIKDEIDEAQIDCFRIGESGIPVADVCTNGGSWYEAMEPKDYYLTREEAEAALEVN